MGRENHYECLPEYAANLIRRKGHDLVGLSGLTKEDRRDIEQELAIQVWRSQAKHDSARASQNTFAARVVDNKIANILEARRAVKRSADVPPLQPLDGRDLDDETGEVIDISDMLAAERRRQRADDLQADVAKVVGQLPGKLRGICQRLLDSSITEVANETNTPRSSLYGSLTEVRRHFERAGLRRYLQPDVFPRASVSTAQGTSARRRR